MFNLVNRIFILFSYPSVRCINKQKTHVIEGQLRCKELASFLDCHKTKKIVWLSEDATALISRINYDPVTNQIVGIILPTDNNGCPIPFRYFLLHFEILDIFVIQKTLNLFMENFSIQFQSNRC